LDKKLWQDFKVIGFKWLITKLRWLYIGNEIRMNVIIYFISTE
jgi:hypothetical protein